MTNTTQPVALRLADRLDANLGDTRTAAAAELRSQHAHIAELEREKAARHYKALALEAQPSRECLHQIAEPAPEFDVSTSAGGRGYVAWHFVNVLKRHDFTSYIHGALAADFACALARSLQAAPPAPAAVAVPPDWWRKRADEIELQVARSGSTEAMRCYTDMRTLLQASAAPAQEHATQLAGQGQPVAWRYQTATGWHATTDATAAMRVRNHHPIEPLYASMPAAPAQAQEDPVIVTVNDIPLKFSWAEGALQPGEHKAQEDARPDQRRRVKALLDLLNHRPAMNDGLTLAYAHWNARCYQVMGAQAKEPANDNQAQEDARDLGWLTKEGRTHGFHVVQTIVGAVVTHSTESLRAAIDAARAAQGGAA